MLYFVAIHFIISCLFSMFLPRVYGTEGALTAHLLYRLCCARVSYCPQAVVDRLGITDRHSSNANAYVLPEGGLLRFSKCTALVIYGIIYSGTQHCSSKKAVWAQNKTLVPMGQGTKVSDARRHNLFSIVLRTEVTDDVVVGTIICRLGGGTL